MVGSGILMPASKQARSPSAASCVFELSPVAGPSFIFLIGTCWTILGFTRSPGGAPNSFGPAFSVATDFAGLGTVTSFTNSDGFPYDHWPFTHWLSTRNCAHW